MSKFMYVAGIIMLAVGAALGLVGLVNPSQILIYGLSLESALDLIIGGILSFGIGGVIATFSQAAPRSTVVEHTVETIVEEVVPAAVEPVAEVAAVEVPPPATSKGMRFPNFSRKVEVSITAPVAATAVVAAATAESATSSVQDTLDALDQAKTELQNVFGSKPAIVAVEHEPEAEPEEIFDDAAEPAEGELFVVEDKVVRGRPARVLSDGTVEAETDEGWMRFENLEHLDEYLDAIDAS